MFGQLSFIQGIEVDLTFPEALGLSMPPGRPDLPIFIIDMGTLPPGLTFSSGATRRLTGTPNMTGVYTFRYLINDISLASANLPITAEFFDPLVLTQTDFTFPRNIATTDLTLAVASGGIAPLTYTLTTSADGGDLPDDLSFDAASRVLSGTPSVAATTSLNYSDTSETGNTVLLKGELKF